MQQQPHPPAVLNPFRTPNQQLHHHLQHQRNTSNCGLISKDGNNNIYGIHNKNRCMIVANSWIENPILRIGYMMGITMLLICLMMVGYEAYRKFSNHVTHKLILGPPFSVVTVNTDTHSLPLDNANVAMDETEDALEKIVLPEILYKIHPKVAKIVGISSGSSSTSGHTDVDGRQSGVRKGAKSSTSSSQQNTGTKDDDEIVDEEEVDTADRLTHDSITAKATDDNVEQILRPKEIHSKLLGMATKDYLQSAIHDEQEQSYHGFGGDIIGNQDGITAVASEDHPQDNMVVVVLPLRKGEELLKLPPAPDRHETMDHSSRVVVEVPDIQPLPSLEDATSTTNAAATVERSRRLRHHVVAIPTSSQS